MLKGAIEDIQSRNAFRREAGLEPLSIPKELRRIYIAVQEQKRAAFLRTSPLRQPIEKALLAEERAKRADPNWRPTGFFGGYAFATEVKKRLLRHMR